VRWWNVKHPAAYAARLAQGVSPAAAREVLTPADQQVERLLLGIRLRDGLPIEFLDKRQQEMIAGQISSGLLVPCGSSVQLTSKGRLLADAVVRDLLD
jgi:oxygen-independent coproporphyrinogen-3 oxidase